ncbi:hypothetical protein JCM8097_000076 [Rhodosporidiobolus ruineniae]
MTSSTPALPVLTFGQLEQPDDAALPSFPTYLLPSHSQPDPSTSSAPAARSSSGSPLDLQHVARAVLKAKRVAVVCGAGISTATGIPDFRSGAGLFKSLKEQYPDAKLSSGKDLFDVGLFSSESNAAIFYNMIAELKKQADSVEPTPFHSWLKELDDEGKLFRVYTQNIDALEEKAGLTYGLGDRSLPLPPRRASRSPTKARPSAASSLAATPKETATPQSVSLEPSSSQASLDSAASYPTPRPSASPTPPPVLAPSPPPTHSTIPRVIPLHGHLQTLSCSYCKHVTPTASYLPQLSSGSAPACPNCYDIEATRLAAGGRSRGVGMLRPDVVLYGEEHKDGERVGEITRRDLMGQRPDLLIVVGTTLKVKGTKRLVRELAKVIKPTAYSASSAAAASSSSSSSSRHPSSSAPTRSTRKRPRGSDSPSKPSPSSSSSSAADPPQAGPIHTLYLNYDFPTPSRDWQGLFDCWLRGDIQAFVEAVRAEKEVVQLEEKEKLERRERKKARTSSSSAALNALGRIPNGPLSALSGSRSAGTTAAPPSPAKGANKFATEPAGARAPPKDRTAGAVEQRREERRAEKAAMGAGPVPVPGYVQVPPQGYGYVHPPPGYPQHGYPQHPQHPHPPPMPMASSGFSPPTYVHPAGVPPPPPSGPVMPFSSSPTAGFGRNLSTPAAVGGFYAPSPTSALGAGVGSGSGAGSGRSAPPPPTTLPPAHQLPPLPSASAFAASSSPSAAALAPTSSSSLLAAAAAPTAVTTSSPSTFSVSISTSAVDHISDSDPPPPSSSQPVPTQLHSSQPQPQPQSQRLAVPPRSAIELDLGSELSEISDSEEEGDNGAKNEEDDGMSELSDLSSDDEKEEVDEVSDSEADEIVLVSRSTSRASLSCSVTAAKKAPAKGKGKGKGKKEKKEKKPSPASSSSSGARRFSRPSLQPGWIRSAAKAGAEMDPPPSASRSRSRSASVASGSTASKLSERRRSMPRLSLAPVEEKEPQPKGRTARGRKSAGGGGEQVRLDFSVTKPGVGLVTGTGTGRRGKKTQAKEEEEAPRMSLRARS